MYRYIARQLLVWGGASVVLGAVGLLVPGVSPFLRGFALQTVIWGAIDGALGTLGLWRPARRLKKILLINSGIDLIYVAVGVALLLYGRDDSYLQGNGWAIIVQGTFLFFFDLYHGIRLPAEPVT